MPRTHDLVGRVVEHSAIFSVSLNQLILFNTLSAVLTTVWPAHLARLSVQRVVLKLG